MAPVLSLRAGENTDEVQELLGLYRDLERSTSLVLLTGSLDTVTTAQALQSAHASVVGSMYELDELVRANPDHAYSEDEYARIDELSSSTRSAIERVQDRVVDFLGTARRDLGSDPRASN